VESIFKVNGRTFFPIGGQCHNSSAYSPKDLDRFWKAMEVLGGNTAEIPIYWDKIEPEEGKFDFSSIDSIIKQAREKKSKLIILWFATWKNGVMNYAPVWVKTNTDRFKRVIAQNGSSLFVLSSHCSENLNADCKAFKAVMQHIHKVDDKEHTVIGMQVENEPGILGRSYRDHGPEAEKEFMGPVPAFIVDAMKKKSSGPAFEIWKQNGSKLSGNWPELFGIEASELFTAHSIAEYIDKIVYEGKKIHNIPMIVNVWLDQIDWELPGISYPCGAPEEKTLDIWKWTTKSIDIIAPDLHKNSTKVYCHHCSVYDREDNALFAPESSCSNVANSIHIFYAIGKYNAIGYFPFGLEDIMLNDGSVNPAALSFIGSVKAISAAFPLITKYRGTGRIYPVVQEEFMQELQMRNFEGYNGLVKFDELGYIDYLHREYNFDETPKERGRGLVIQPSKDEFYVLGSAFTLFLREKPTEIEYAEEKRNNIMRVISIEEGHFDVDGNWFVDRTRNGDEGEGIWVFPDCGVVRVVMCQ